MCLIILKTGNEENQNSSRSRPICTEAFQQKTGFTATCSTHGLIKIKTENIFSAKNLQLNDLPGCVSLPDSSNQAVYKDEFPLLSAL